jgi:purine-cytosine permease-like protein
MIDRDDLAIEETHVAEPSMIEHRSIDYVPLAERRGKVWHLWPTWFMGGAHLATIATGVVGITLGGNFIWMTIAVIAGCLLGTLFMAFHSTQGPHLGLPQMIQSRPQFGYVGALLVWGVALITFVGFNAFNQVLAADTIETLYHTRSWMTIPIIGVLAAILAVFGYDWIHRTQRILTVILLAGMILMSIMAFRIQLSPAQLDINDFRLTPFLTQLFASAAYQLSWSIYVSDYSRYLPKNVGVVSSFGWTFLGALLGGVWTMLVGTFAAAMFPSLALTPALKMAADTMLPGSGDTLLIVSLLGLVTITTLNFYGASLTLLSVVDSLRPVRSTAAKRSLAILACWVVATTIALTASKDFAKDFGEFLAVLLYLFTPWTAINLVDFFFVRRGQYSVREIFNANGLYGRWNWRGLLAYAVGFIAMIPFFSTGLYEGAIARMLGGADLAMLIGLPVSAIVYLWSCRSMDITTELEAARIADIGLDPTP